MGIFGAMATAITGLRAQAYALEHVSGNIANSQTPGFKRTETNFTDLIPAAPVNRQISGSVIGYSRGTTAVQGDIQSSDSPTNMAINGDGYFLLGQASGFTDGRPVFDGSTLYTRRGDFEFDASGFLVTGSGYYLQGLPVDPTTGNVSASVPQVIQVSNDFLPAKPTETINYRANLAKYPLNTIADPNVPGSEFLNPANFANTPTVGNDAVVLGQDIDTFIASSISGGAVTTFDSTGAPVNVQLRWA